jgi:Fe-S cluster assembly protein SufD
MEEWKYTDLRTLMRDAKPLAGRPDQTRPAPPAIADALPGIDAHRVAIVNGAYAPAWSDLAGADPGVALIDLFAWIADNLTAYQDLIAQENDVVTALNTAFVTG